MARARASAPGAAGASDCAEASGCEILTVMKIPFSKGNNISNTKAFFHISDSPKPGFESPVGQARPGRTRRRFSARIPFALSN
jgi:hypothetical protein